MSRLLTSFERATERFNGSEIGNRFRADDSIWNHSGQRSDGMRIRVTVPSENAGTKRAITKWDWQQTLAISRQLFGRVGEIAGAIRQKATYVIGDSWQPQFQGKNQAWGRAAEQWLESWFEVANVRGEPFDFVTSLFVDSIAIDRDGDSAMHVCYDESTGEPRIKFYPAHQIGFRQGTNQDQNGYGTVPKLPQFGVFGGMLCYNGVVFSGAKVVAYGILGDKAENDRVLGTDVCQLLYDPDWADQGRGIPAVARASTLSTMDYEDIVHFIKRQVKQDSALGLMHYNEEGSAPSLTAADFMDEKPSGSDNQDVKIEQLEGNEIMYFKALGGGKIETIKSDRPHPNVDAHNMRLLRGILLSMGWFYELYDPTQVGGASTRLIQDQARANVNHRQRLIYRRFARAIAHALSFAIDRGELPPNEEADWLNFWPTLPSKITVDARYDDKTKMERIRMGAGTYAALFGDEGRNWQNEIDQRIEEQAYFQKRCKEKGVDIEKVQILTPNGNPQGEKEKEEGEGEDQDMLETEKLKAQFDAFGVGVRAGAITPTPADEDYFRSIGGLPPTSAEALSDWEKTNKVRKPITLVSADGARPTPGGQPQAQPEDKE